MCLFIRLWIDEIFEIEFADINGRTYASTAVPKSRLMVLHHQPADRAA
jgi:hypothetical protein